MLGNLDSRVADGRHRAHPLVLLCVCAAASFGLVFIKARSLLDFAMVRPIMQEVLAVEVTEYVFLAAPVIALVVWHVFGGRAVPWLLLAGALGAFPWTLLALLSPESYSGSMYNSLAVLTGSAPSFTMIGILAAATQVWQEGRRGAGAALIGTALAIQLLGPMVMGSTEMQFQEYFAAVSMVLVVVAIVGAVGAVVVTIVLMPAPSEPPVRPSWRVTLAGGLAAVSPAVFFAWQADPSTAFGQRGVAVAGDYYLYLGLVFLAIGLIVGAAAGARALLGSLAAGLLLGSFGMLIWPSVEVLREMVVLTVIASLGSVLLGWLAALSRWRVQIGTTGLTLLVIGLVVLYTLFNSDMDLESYEGFTRGLTPVLLVIGVVAGVAGIASIGTAHAPHAETPAVLAGLTVPFALAAITIIAHVTVHTPPDKAPLAGLLAPAAAGIFIATVLIGALAARRSVHAAHQPADGWARDRDE